MLIIGAASETKFNCKIVEQVRRCKYSQSVDFLMRVAKGEEGLDGYPFERVFFVKNSYKFSDLISLFALIRRYDSIILNGMFYRNSVLMLLSMLCFGKKTGWIIWGGDLYREHGSIRKFCISLLRLSYLAISVPQDYNVYYKKFGEFKGVKVDFWFPHSVDILPEPKKHFSSIECTRVMVGNSATSSNRHVSVFDMLAGQLDQNFTVVLPLAYGDSEYKTYIIDYAIKTFGRERVEIADQFIPANDYAEFIQSIDVIIYNHDRQQGGQTILLAAALGVSLVLCKENPFYEFLANENVCVNSFENLVDIKKLKSPTIESVEAARKIISDDFSFERVQRFVKELVC